MNGRIKTSVFFGSGDCNYHLHELMSSRVPFCFFDVFSFANNWEDNAVIAQVKNLVLQTRKDIIPNFSQFVVLKHMCLPISASSTLIFVVLTDLAFFHPWWSCHSEGLPFLLLIRMNCFLPRHRLASGTSESIQLSSLVAAFQVARDLVAQEANWKRTN